MNCSMIFVLDKGKIQERGKFRELNRFKGMDFEEEEADIEKDKKKAKKGEKPDEKAVTKEKKDGYIDFTTLEVN